MGVDQAVNDGHAGGETAPILRYESPAHHYATPPPNAEPHTVPLGQITIRESFESDPGKVPPGEGRYRLIAEAKVESVDQLDEIGRSIHQIADELDRCWIYSAGTPLTGEHLGSFGIVHTPDGWTSNVLEIGAALRGEPYLNLELGANTVLLGMPALRHFPLRHALYVRERFLTAEPGIRSLIEFHYLAKKQLVNSDARLFLLAKGLEIARAMLPGRTDPERQSSLPTRFIERLRLPDSLHDLFDLANHRRDIRHAVRNPRGVELHQRLTHEERADFDHDADIILRGVVSREFNLKPIG